MITARYEPSLLFPRERSPSPHVGNSRCTPPPSSSSSLTDGEDIDRFMELAHAALEEATKEEDAKGVLHELMERVLIKTGAPLLAGVIAEQWRSQEVIEQLAERSFERQKRRQLQQQRSPLLPSVSLSANKKKRRMKRPASESTRNEKTPLVSSTPIRPSSSPIQQTVPSSSFLPSSTSSTSTSTSLSSESDSSVAATLKGSLDPDSMDEAVVRDQFIIQQSHSLHAEPDRLLLISEYIWRLFRLLILASLVALVYHYVCTYPHQLFLVV